jgi:hypothetical protein
LTALPVPASAWRFAKKHDLPAILQLFDFVAIDQEPLRLRSGRLLPAMLFAWLNTILRYLCDFLAKRVLNIIHVRAQGGASLQCSQAGDFEVVENERHNGYELRITKS